MDADALLDELTQNPDAVSVRRSQQMSFDQLIASHLEPASDSPTEAIPALKRASPPAPAAAGPVTGRHQDVRLYLTVLLKTYAETIDAGLVRDAPYRVHPAAGRPIEPDIVFVSHMSFDRVHETYVEGPPDIIVEVVSVESAAADRGEKFVTYEAMGVREYWIIDPLRELVNFYHLGPDGQYDEFRADLSGRLHSRVLKGFVLDVDRLWKRILPTTVEIVEMVQSMVNQR